MLVSEKCSRGVPSRRRFGRRPAGRVGHARSIGKPRMNQSRWFDPTVGRWLSEDPAGLRLVTRTSTATAGTRRRMGRIRAGLPVLPQRRRGSLPPSNSIAGTTREKCSTSTLTRSRKSRRKLPASSRVLMV